MDIEPGQVEKNISRIQQMTTMAASNKADLVVFPEIATTDYDVDDFFPLAEPVPGKQSSRISKAASDNGIYIAVGLLEKVSEGIYNTCLLISPEGQIIGKYRKTHLSVDDRDVTIAKEVDVFLAGNDLPVFDMPLGKLGIMICKDGDYPEVSRVLAVKGAEIIFWMTNRWGVIHNNCMHYAFHNKIGLVVCNRAKGYADGGGSAIFDFDGKLISRANQQETIIYAELDMDNMRKERQLYWTQQRMRRPELYNALVEKRNPI